jgi:hypothetical protein
MLIASLLLLGSLLLPCDPAVDGANVTAGVPSVAGDPAVAGVPFVGGVSAIAGVPAIACGTPPLLHT